MLDPLKICNKPKKVDQLAFLPMKLWLSQQLDQRMFFLLFLLYPKLTNYKVGIFISGKNQMKQFWKY
jgi:hypothetical protein